MRQTLTKESKWCKNLDSYNARAAPSRLTILLQSAPTRQNKEKRNKIKYVTRRNHLVKITRPSTTAHVLPPIEWDLKPQQKCIVKTRVNATNKSTPYRGHNNTRANLEPSTPDAAPTPYPHPLRVRPKCPAGTKPREPGHRAQAVRISTYGNNENKIKGPRYHLSVTKLPRWGTKMGVKRPSAAHLTPNLEVVHTVPTTTCPFSSLHPPDTPLPFLCRAKMECNMASMSNAWTQILCSYT
jgi:hypothetical protein